MDKALDVSQPPGMFGKFVVNSGQENEEKTEKDLKKVSDGDFEEKSCFVLKRTFFVRKWFIHLVHWPYPLKYSRK
jgi:hypothetical protein